MKNRYIGAIKKGKVFPISDFFLFDDLGNLQMKGNLITYDLETTGLDPIHDDITQIAFSIFSPNFKLIESKSVFCKLKRKKFEDISPDIIKKTKITKELLMNGSDIEKVIGNFLLNAENSIIASYNGWGFDDKFITAKIYQYIQKPFWPTIFMSDIDVLLLAIGAFFEKDEKMSLQNISKIVKSDFNEFDAHNAQYDVIKTAAVIPGIMKALYADNKNIGEECILRFQKSNLVRWRFKRYDDPWPATSKQLNFAHILLNRAYATQGLKSILEWILLNVLTPEQVLAFLETGETSFVDSFSKIEANEIISSLLFLQNIGINLKRVY